MAGKRCLDHVLLVEKCNDSNFGGNLLSEILFIPYSMGFTGYSSSERLATRFLNGSLQGAVFASAAARQDLLVAWGFRRSVALLLENLLIQGAEDRVRIVLAVVGFKSTVTAPSSGAVILKAASECLPRQSTHGRTVHSAG